MGDPVVPWLAPSRATVALMVPGGRHGLHADEGAAPTAWELQDGFEPSVSASALPNLSPLQLAQAFLSGVCADRVALHRSLEESFEVAVTLADAAAWRAAVDRIGAHFRALAEVADALGAELTARGLGALAALVSKANAQEAELVKAAMALHAARHRMVTAGDEGDEAAEVQAQGGAAAERMAELMGELNESLSELRCEAADLE